MEFEFHFRGFERRLAVCFVLSPLHSLGGERFEHSYSAYGYSGWPINWCQFSLLFQLSVCVKWATPSNPMMGLPRFRTSPAHKLSWLLLILCVEASKFWLTAFFIFKTKKIITRIFTLLLNILQHFECISPIHLK